jgi:hypothetical protein
MATEALDKLYELGSRDVTLFVLREYQCGNGHVAALLVEFDERCCSFELEQCVSITGSGRLIFKEFTPNVIFCEAGTQKGEIGIDHNNPTGGK